MYVAGCFVILHSNFRRMRGGSGLVAADPDNSQSITDNTGADSDNSQPTTDNTGTDSNTTRGREGSGHEYEYIEYLYNVYYDFIAQDGYVLYGRLMDNRKIQIADGATIILRDAAINGINWEICPWAGLTCVGDATIILEGTNSIRGFHQSYPGIYVPEGKTLTIKGTGSLTATSNGYAPGIGGGRGEDLRGGNIVIEGGTIIAKAYGNNAGYFAAGIGSGYGSSCGNITIDGGIVRAEAGTEAAAIGAGKEASCGTITITDKIDELSAVKGKNAPDSMDCIGAGVGGTCGTVTIHGKTGTVTESPYVLRTKTGLSTLTSDYQLHDNEKLTGTLGQNVKISIADGATVTLSSATINGKSVYSCKWAGLTCEGNAVIILEGDNTVKGFWDDYPGIYVPEGKTLTIKGEGSLTASSNGWGAGIGGGEYSNCGNIVIESGTIIAEGGTQAAGIGSTTRHSCGTITITGGTVTASGGTKGSGIGTERRGRCTEIAITGGTVTAKGDEGASGIGSGSSGTCGKVSISGGSVTAEGGRFGAGIGTGEEEAHCSEVLITGGIVSATGGEYAAGIGGGTDSACGSITITDTVERVTAVRGLYADHSIGAGAHYIGEKCIVTIGGVEGEVSESPCIYEPNKH